MKRQLRWSDPWWPRPRASATALCILLAGASASQAQLGLARHVLAGGAGVSSSPALTMLSTLGQAAIGHEGSAAWTAEIGFWLPLSSGTISVPEAEAWPSERFELGPCGPNPVGRVASLGFGVPIPTPVTIRLFDVAGREIRILTDAEYPAGRHQVAIESRGIPSGVYLCRMTAGKFHATYRLILAK
jgi:hypothetical protein